MNKLTIGLLSLILPALAWAQDDVDAADSGEVRRYTVEVIIFRYTENIGTGSEVFLPDEPVEPEEADTAGLLDTIDAEVSVDTPVERGDAAEPPPETELVLLDEDSFQLGEAYGRLERLEAYEPLMHFGWTQATLPEDQSRAIPLHLFGRPPEELDGSLTLYLSRFLHLVVDLQLRAPRDTGDAAASTSGFDGFGTSQGVTGEAVARPVYYRISENRILRNGEMRYYDHPKFGLLAKVTRADDEAATDDGELLGYPIQ